MAPRMLITDLPDEIIEVVFRRLAPGQAACFRAVNRRFRQLYFSSITHLSCVTIPPTEVLDVMSVDSLRCVQLTLPGLVNLASSTLRLETLITDSRRPDIMKETVSDCIDFASLGSRGTVLQSLRTLKFCDYSVELSTDDLGYIASYATNLETFAFPSRTVPSLVNRFPVFFPHLRSLSLNGSRLSHRDIDCYVGLGKCTTLTSLKIAHCGTSMDNFVKAISGCTALTSLKLPFCPRIASTLAVALAKALPILKVFDLTSCSVTDAGVAGIASAAPQLESFSVGSATADQSITDYALLQLSLICRNLTKLDIHGATEVTTVGFKYIAGSWNLRSLNLSGTKFEPDAAVVFGPRRGVKDVMEKLDLSRCSLLSKSVSTIMKGKFHLRYLNLARISHLDDAAAKEIAANCSKLVYLNLSLCNNISDAGISAVCGVNSDLQHLDISHNDRVSGASIRVIAKACRSLQYLNLRDCVKMTDNAMWVLQQSCFGLTHLFLSDCPLISNTGLTSIAKMHSLLYLDLSENFKITNDGAVQLCALTRLRSLVLRACSRLTDAVLEDLRKSCPLAVIVSSS